MDKVCGVYYTIPDSDKKIIQGGLRTKYSNISDFKNMEMPLVTIITVVLNRANQIERAIKSVLGQTYGNIELIIIDGGSTDGTMDIIKKYEDSVDYYLSECDGGIYYAMNKGLSLARGEYIGILNSDDWLTDDAVEISVDALVNSGCDYTGAHEYKVDTAGNIVSLYHARPFDEVAFLGLPPCPHGSMFISNKSYNAIGYYDTKYSSASDYKMQCLLIKNKSLKGVVVDKYLRYFSVDGMTGSATGIRNSLLQVKKIVMEFFENDIPNMEVESLVRFLLMDDRRGYVLKSVSQLLDRELFTMKQERVLVEMLKNI